MELVEKSKTYRLLAEKLIRRLPSLRYISEAGIKIAYAESDKDKTEGKRMIYADCRKVPALYRPWCDYDFLITVYTPNADLLSDNQKILLMWHELLHVGVDDSSGELKMVVNPHDFEDFHIITDRFGLDWNNPGREIDDDMIGVILSG